MYDQKRQRARNKMIIKKIRDKPDDMIILYPPRGS